MPKTTIIKKTTKKASKVSSVKSKKPFSTYKQAMDYLCQRTDYEKEKNVRYNVTTFNLSRMHQFLEYLGDPHKKLETVHIAGTKGKGSTATMLAKMLEANDLKIGLYTSPHLVNIRERIQVNSQMICQEELLNLITRAHASIEKMAKKDPLSFFEIMTALAFLHFADHKVDIAVIETGLGGRLDSTNVIKPKVIGITSLSIDHQQQLGKTIESIAKEKAGIFKKGIPVFTVKQRDEAMSVLLKEADSLKSPIFVTGRDIGFSYRFETSREEGPHTRICLSTPTSKFEHLKVPMPGKHQAVNCSLALSMLDYLKTCGHPIDYDKSLKGLSTVSVPGRMEMICEDPRIIIDAAHNAASIHALVHAIGQHVPYDSLVVIFGCNSDKDIEGMMEQLQYGADKAIFTRSTSAKAVPPEELAEVFTRVSGKMCQTASCLGEALKMAQTVVSKEDLICVTGSFYLIGQAKLRFQPHLADIYPVTVS